MKPLFALCLGMCAALPQAASARFTELVCDDRARLQDQLQTIVGAEPLARGVRDPDAMIEIWIVPGSGDWTIVQNYASGTSCIVAMGEYWEDITPSPAAFQ